MIDEKENLLAVVGNGPEKILLENSNTANFGKRPVTKWIILHQLKKQHLNNLPSDDGRLPDISLLERSKLSKFCRCSDNTVSIYYSRLLSTLTKEIINDCAC